MLMITPIKNVNNTLNNKNNISFGVRSNELLGAPNVKDSMVGGGLGGLLTGFVGTVKNSPLFNFNQTVDNRSKSIEEGLEENLLNIMI